MFILIQKLGGKLSIKVILKKLTLITIITLFIPSFAELVPNKGSPYQSYQSPLETFVNHQCDMEVFSSYVSATIKIPMGDTVEKGNSLIQGKTKRYFIDRTILYRTPIKITTYERYPKRRSYRYQSNEIFYICSHKKNLFIENKRVLRHKYRQYRDEITLELSEF